MAPEASHLARFSSTGKNRKDTIDGRWIMLMYRLFSSVNGWLSYS
jgi:hypothetical protein